MLQEDRRNRGKNNICISEPKDKNILNDGDNKDKSSTCPPCLIPVTAELQENEDLKDEIAATSPLHLREQVGNNLSTIIEEDESSVEISNVSDGRGSATETIVDACEDEIQSREEMLDVFCGSLHPREGISSPESSEGSSSEEEA